MHIAQPHASIVSAVIVAKYRMMSRGKKSLTWEFYSVREDPKFAVCSASGQKISRGDTNIR